MKLLKFRVTDFRSIEDSGWISTGSITTLVGANESGKTNLMKALWKLNADNGVGVDTVLDLPRQKYYALIAAPLRPVFVTAAFEFTTAEAQNMDVFAGKKMNAKFVYIGKDYDNLLHYEFCDTADTDDFVSTTIAVLQNFSNSAKQAGNASLYNALNAALAEFISPTQNSLAATVHLIAEILQPFANEGEPMIARLVQEIMRRDELLTLGLNPDVQAYLRDAMPKFLFYASSCNLDGEIYLPQMCDNFHRSNLRGHELDRARTAKKFFELLGHTPEEMLDLGRQIMNALTDEKKVETFLMLKEKSESILNTAEARFNRVFQTWSGDCNFKFDFKLDGDYVRVRVLNSDGAEPIELEHRSEWIQWLFSFCINLMGAESGGHILLLDEPELALHPLSQIDLRELLEAKAKQMQMLFCTHSPYLVNYEFLDRVVNVYNDAHGYTVTGEDLKVSSRTAQIQAGFALSSAVTLGISTSLLYGCIPVMTETVSDQIYLSLFKNLLASVGELRTRREMVFIPCGGRAGVKAVLPLLVGKNNFLPAFVAGGDRIDLIDELIARTSVFARHPNRAITVGEESGTCLEDLVPKDTYKGILEKYLGELGATSREISLGTEGSVVRATIRLAAVHNYNLPINWRTEMAQRIRQVMVGVGVRAYADDVAKWETIKTLFNELVKL